MTYKLVLLGVLVGLAVVHTQQGIEIEEIEDDQYQQQQQDRGQQGSDQQEVEKARQISVGCVILCKQRMFNDKSYIQGLMVGQDQQKLIRKINAQYLLQCYQNLNIKAADQLMKQLQSKTFDVQQYNYIFNDMDLDRFKQLDQDLELGSIERQLMDLQDQFEQQMKQQQNTNRNENEERETMGQDDYEPKIMGLSFIRLSYQTKLLVMSLIIFLFFLGFYLSLQLMQPSDQRVLKKLKKNEGKKPKMKRM